MKGTKAHQAVDPNRPKPKVTKYHNQEDNNSHKEYQTL
jgi:hypothetical protein